MEPKRVSWLGVTYCPSLPKNMAKTSGYTVMTGWQLFKEKPQQIEKIKKDLYM